VVHTGQWYAECEHTHAHATAENTAGACERIRSATYGDDNRSDEDEITEIAPGYKWRHYARDSSCSVRRQRFQDLWIFVKLVRTSTRDESPTRCDYLLPLRHHFIVITETDKRT